MLHGMTRCNHLRQIPHIGVEEEGRIALTRGVAEEWDHGCAVDLT